MKNITKDKIPNYNINNTIFNYNINNTIFNYNMLSPKTLFQKI